MGATPGEPCSPLPWDSDHFGFPVARVRGELLTEELARTIDDWCGQNRIRCLYFLAHPEDPETARAAERAGYRLVDRRIDMTLRLDPGEPARPDWGPELRLATAEDGPALDRIGRSSFHLTRFYFDRHFPVERADALYAIWVRRSLEGYADANLVTGTSGNPTGLVTCHLPSGGEAARIGLLGVASAHQGQGVGSTLLQGGVEWFRRAEVDRVEVATQERNLAARRLYQRAGFGTGRVRSWYHKWYE